MKNPKQSPPQVIADPERRLAAVAVSRGIGIGRVVFLHGVKMLFFRIDLDAGQVESEVQRFRSAVSQSKAQLQDLAANNDPNPSQPVSSIFGVHLLIIEESSLTEKIETVIRDEKVNAEWALKIISDQYLKKQSSIPDPYFREKYLDIEDVADRLLMALSGSLSTAQLTYSGAVVAAREMRPSAIMELTKCNPVALITERGGWTSHSSILAREFKLPMVSGIRNIEKVLAHGDYVIVDGMNGEVIIRPILETIKSFRAIESERTIPDESLTETGKGAITLDGTEIVIRANIDSPVPYLGGARGIGLYRSESLIRRPGGIPTEDAQMEAYKQISFAAGGCGVKIRTFDTGIDYFEDSGFSSERNPSLGLRSIRLSLSNSGHFRTQIRAILRAAFEQRIDIVLPMISGVTDIQRSKSIIDDERKVLSDAGIPIGDPRIGAMIEVPSAVFTAREIAQKVDFLCLGTNDLVQYLLAVDRDNDSVADWYQTLHPAVIRAITEVLSAAKGASIPVTVCGEMAGSPFYVPLLIGLGACELSMNVNSIRHVRHLISGITFRETVDLVEKIKTCETAEGVERQLRLHYVNHWYNLFPTGLLNSRHR